MEMDNGQWTMDNGQWTMDNGQWFFVNRYSLIVMALVSGIWKGERTDERCYAYMKALA